MVDKCPNCGWSAPVEQKVIGNFYNKYVDESNPKNTCKMANNDEKVTSTPLKEGVKPIVWIREDVWIKAQEDAQSKAQEKKPEQPPTK